MKQRKLKRSKEKKQKLDAQVVRNAEHMMMQNVNVVTNAVNNLVHSLTKNPLESFMISFILYKATRVNVIKYTAKQLGLPEADVRKDLDNTELKLLSQNPQLKEAEAPKEEGN